MSGKVTNKIARDRERHCKLIKGSICEENIAKLNVDVLNKTA